MDSIQKGDIFSVFETIGAIGSLYFVFSPYYVSYSVFQESRDFYNNLNIGDKITKEHETNVMHFTDTFYEVNGVVATLQQTLLQAKQQQKKYNFITCSDRDSLLGEKVFKPIDVYDLPEYPEMKLAIPPILDIIDYCFENKVTHIHTSTPGTMGIAALITSMVLRKPLIGTYHTAFPQYVRSIIGDSFIEDITRGYLKWYYDLCDEILVPSEAFKEDLIKNGLSNDKIHLSPRGVDTDFFTPDFDMKRSLNSNKYKLLYVGRISKEKGLDKLAETYKTIYKKKPVKLTIVGDGPFRKEMEQILKGTNAEFTGYLKGEKLLNHYRSADLFVFPSLTDTFGNVVLEANACGTPVIVTDKGGPHENVINGVNGYITNGNDINELKNTILKAIDAKGNLQQMFINSRKFVEERTFKKAFLKLWEFHENIK